MLQALETELSELQAAASTSTQLLPDGTGAVLGLVLNSMQRLHAGILKDEEEEEEEEEPEAQVSGPGTGLCRWRGTQDQAHTGRRSLLLC